MGGTSSCLPTVFNSKTHRLHRRRFFNKKKIEQTESTLPKNVNNSHKNTIDLNLASEDELLLVPGINRSIAQNIIEYRRVHQQIKHIDELLLITEINRDLFERIRSDVSVGNGSQMNNTETKSEIININRATYEELCSIPHLNPTLVQRILHQRKRKGSFRFIEDLLQIKGIDYIILANIRSYITIDSHPLSSAISETSVFHHSTTNTEYPTLNKNNNNNNDQHVLSDTLSLASLLLETLPPELQTILLSSPPQRPSPVTKNKQTFIRFASWNLQQLTNDKVQNPGVKEVICRILLENNFSIIGIQEIGHKEALGYIVEELNNPTIPLIKDWPNRYQGKWRYSISEVAGRMFQSNEYLGFLYDESIGIELKKSSLLPFKNYFTRSPFINIFRIFDKYEFVFVNIHLKARRLDENENERTKDEALSLSILAEAMSDTVEQKNIIIFGDFNLAPHAAEFEALVQRHYSYVIQKNTNISLKVPQGSTCVDNIWLSAEAKQLSTDNLGVIRDNLTSMWIPAGWTWGGLVSDHCPIWIEFDLSS